MDEQSKNIVAILEQKKAMIKENRDVLAPIIVSIKNVLERFYGKDKAFVQQAEVLHTYLTALQTSKKDVYPVYTRCNTKDVATDMTALIESVIDEIKTIGLPQTSQSKESKGIQINNTLSQSQSQEQSQQQEIVAKILLDAVKDELKGKQLKELLAIAEEIKDPQEAHKSILEKLKEYGADVSASIVANILTNPNVWSTLGSLL